MIEKLNLWLLGAMAAGMLTACSSEDIVDSGKTQKPDEPTHASGYISLQINLPSQPDTRAGEGDNVEYKDGDQSEYAVKSAELVLFKGTDEKSAMVIGTYDLVTTFSKDQTDNQITSSVTDAVAVDATLGESENLYALVLLNAPSDLSFSNDTQFYSSDVSGNDVVHKVNDVVDGFVSSNYIFMTNAPLSNVQGGGVTSVPNVSENNITTLAYLDKSKLKSSASEAKADPAGCVYVERAVAKVTASVASTNLVKIDVNGSVDNHIALNADVYVALVNVNSKSYIVRNVIDLNANDKSQYFKWNLASENPDNVNVNAKYYRMIGNVVIGKEFTGHPSDASDVSLYRTYWAFDPNYNTSLLNNSQISDNSFTPTNVEFTSVASAKFYPKENTFDVAHQTYGNTTLAIFKVIFKVGENAGDLYVLNDDDDTFYISEADVTSEACDWLLRQDAIKNAIGASGVLKSGKNIADVTDYIKIDFTLTSATGDLKANGITLDTQKTGASDIFENDAVSLFTQALASSKETLLSTVNSSYKIKKYSGGVSYYVVPIAHFNDTSTPWKANGNSSELTTDDAYGTGSDATRDFLGRYGLVRNNWYELNVNEFKKIGSPVIPALSVDLSDDNNEVKKYIGIETHIFSWAKRTQSIKF